jgi:hypothetical protein
LQLTICGRTNQLYFVSSKTGETMSPWASPAFTMRDVVEIAVAVALTALACLVFRWYPVFSARVGERFHRSASHVSLCIFAAMLLPLALRLAVLPWQPVPEPRIHDEFSHLLVADTLAAGRLANPPHTLWRHFETIYVLQRPTYSSIYPIGQGITLAVGKVLVGNPWAGVLLSVVLMCGATSWMLFGCLPPEWAAVGGLLAALNYGLADVWVNSYWGGAFCAFGGALLFGALCRLRRSPSLTMALLVGLGWSVVWLIRPFESLLLLMISWALVAVFIIRDPPLWKRRFVVIVLILSIQISAGCVTALHNRAVTGSLTTLPYLYSQQVYGVPQSLLWQKAIKEPPLRFADLKDMYWWQRTAKDYRSTHIVHQLGENLYKTWSFFVGPWYSLPIVLLVFLLKDWQVIVSVGIMTAALAASVLYPFFFPHYIAAYSCVICFLILRGLMTLDQLSFRGRRIGSLAVLFLLAGGFQVGLRIVPPRAILGLVHNPREDDLRAQVSDRLMHVAGRHVVFVRYGANHRFDHEWIYNAANVDASPIVWCRAIDPIDDMEVTRYYKDRHFWIADVDGDTVRVSSYQLGRTLSGTEQDPRESSQEWVLKSRQQ